MKEFILIWVTMMPTPDGSGFTKHWDARGPMDERTCERLVLRMNELAARRSEPHAHIALCRPMTDEAARLLEAIQTLRPPKDEDVST